MANANDEAQNTPAGQILRPMMSAPKAPPRRPAPRPTDECPDPPAEADSQNSPAGAILRPMLPLAEQRRRDLEQIKQLDEERASRQSHGRRQRRRD
jgi:hypothetical protein